MITINKLEILNNGTTLAVDVETTPGYIITSLLFWNMDDFKDYNLAIDLTGKLEQINNKEILLINVTDLEVGTISDMCFIEVESNAPSTCDISSNKNFELTVTVNLLIDSVSKAVDAGFYYQAIDMIKDLQSICNLKDCKNCEKISCNTCNQFKQE